MTRYPIRYSKLMRLLGGMLGLGPRNAWVEVSAREAEVRMGWGFHARFPLTAVTAATRSARPYLSQGVHGRNGRWLVNGSAHGVIRIELSPDQHARVMGRRVRLSLLELSAEDPDGLIRALRAGPGPAG